MMQKQKIGRKSEKAANVYVDSIMKRTEEGVATQLEALRKDSCKHSQLTEKAGLI